MSGEEMEQETKPQRAQCHENPSLVENVFFLNWPDWLFINEKY